VATLQRYSVPANLNQINIQQVYDVYASAQVRDLGSISDDIGKFVGERVTTRRNVDSGTLVQGNATAGHLAIFGRR
jgi:hypothetical protein